MMMFDALLSIAIGTTLALGPSPAPATALGPVPPPRLVAAAKPTPTKPTPDEAAQKDRPLAMGLGVGGGGAVLVAMPIGVVAAVAEAFSSLESATGRADGASEEELHEIRAKESASHRLAAGLGATAGVLAAGGLSMIVAAIVVAARGRSRRPSRVAFGGGRGGIALRF